MKKLIELPFLPVEVGNHLVITSSNKKETRGMDNDDQFYDEVNPNNAVVARYHVWNHMQIYPPQKTDQGWKKTDLAGKVIGEGKQ